MGIALEGTGVTLATVLTSIGDVLTFLIGKFGDLLDMAVSHPALIIPFGIFIVGALIGLASRFRYSM